MVLITSTCQPTEGLLQCVLLQFMIFFFSGGGKLYLTLLYSIVVYMWCELSLFYGVSNIYGLCTQSLFIHCLYDRVVASIIACLSFYCHMKNPLNDKARVFVAKDTRMLCWCRSKWPSWWKPCARSSPNIFRSIWLIKWGLNLPLWVIWVINQSIPTIVGCIMFFMGLGKNNCWLSLN